jgi:hypothetical protein
VAKNRIFQRDTVYIQLAFCTPKLTQKHTHNTAEQLTGKGTPDSCTFIFCCAIKERESEREKETEVEEERN